MNISATLNVFKLIRDPALCLPHHTIPSFNQLPIPLSRAFKSKNGEKEVDIRAVILDKDNCFAAPHQNEVYKPYNDKFEELRRAYPGSRLLIVSNSAGTSSDPSNSEAELLERNTGVKVLRHTTKVSILLNLSSLNGLKSPGPIIDCGVLDILTQPQKPGCRAEVLDYFRSATNGDVTSAKQIAVVGDRLFTDIMMANMMGSYGVWVKDGVTEEKSLVSFNRYLLDATNGS
ncbi:hypothetical protein B0A49_00101 [Cryomyces minteri]|uniref:Phosphatidylglycerophosphatase GEP4, mitochondrial n=1 Tax=Cryomyces minteri TaxID=331657 RepID=A0A4U0XX44_9PEZI|nr:hypothetical protein B0A49_00101 [Cryomyces minteri]